MSDADLLELHATAEEAQLAALAPDAHEPFEIEKEPPGPPRYEIEAPPAGLFSDAGAAAEHVKELLAIANDPRRFALAQATCKRRQAQWPHNGCANMQSALLQMAGFGTPTIMLARVLGLYLEQHGWQKIAVGQERPGDLGSTCGAKPHPGVDHIYLVISARPNGWMWIADNQRKAPHERWVKGHGKSPTTHYLRAILDTQGET